MAHFTYSNHFAAFFGRLNPSPSFERVASTEYETVKALIEDRSGPAAALSPTCFLQGSYRQQTAIYTINDVDIIALCGLWQPGSGTGKSWNRDDIFTVIAATLRADSRYRDLIRYRADSMCIKLDLSIRLEILPVVYKAGNDDPDVEPFRLYRPESRQWEDGFARYHKRWLTEKNSVARTNGTFIPAVKLFKHLRAHHRVEAVSFHLECLLFSLPDALFRGGPADYIPSLLEHIARRPAVEWYRQVIMTPCGDRDIFTNTEWGAAGWVRFHTLISRLAPLARAAAESRDWERGIHFWQEILGAEFFPRDPRP